MLSFNYKIKQLLILTLLIGMLVIAVRELYLFLPGLLGALTLYIISRGSYFQLVFHRKWRKGWTAGLFLLGYTVIIGLIIYLTIALLMPKIYHFLDNPQLMMEKVNAALADVQHKTGIAFFPEDAISDILKRATALVPKLLNDTVMLLFNFAILLFILYYMLVHGKEMEQYLVTVLPLKESNIRVLASETKRILKASALGIPIISIVQGLTAMLGYALFGLNEFVLWGFITGVFAFFPVVGTMIIWIPLVLYMYATGDTWNAVGLFFYSLIITGNVDYVTRIAFLNKWGNVHPVVTVLGVIIGLGLFGFIGLIFGPLLVSYIILLFKIYVNEFIENKPTT